MPEIEIRPAMNSDISSLVELEHYYHTQHVWQVDRTIEEGQVSIHFRDVRLPRQVKVEYPRSPKWLADGWKGQAGLLVALMNSIPVGYITLSEQLSASTAWVRDLVVGEGVRRKGIGSALILAGQDWAGQRGYRRMILELQSKNYPALCLATRLGYEFCGYHDHYYANQDIALFFARYLR